MTVRSPTIDDVARLSGVARTTVSRVLNDGPNVSAKMRAKVLAAVETLGFKVNLKARALAGGTNGTVLLICASSIENEPNSYYQAALEIGALRVSSPLGYELVTHALVVDGDAVAARILRLVDDSRCRGIILTPPFSDMPGLIEALAARPVSMVLISPGSVAMPDMPAVGMDDEGAGYALMEYLLARGHRRFGYIDGLAEHLSAERRLLGIRRAMREAGLAPDTLVAVRGDFTFKSGVELLPMLINDPIRPSAVICANDDMAVGALFAAHRANLQVPHDLSLASFDDTPVSALVWPPLTTVHQPIQEMSARAMQIIAGHRVAGDGKPGGDIEYLPFSIVERGSVGQVDVDMAAPI